MSFERWATFSVQDHLAKNAFVAEVLIYDKLVIPYPASFEDEEWRRWEQRGWNPEYLEKCFHKLGSLVEPVPWDEFHRQEFADRREAARQTGQDAYWTTKRFLQQKLENKQRRSEIPIRPVVAYTSQEEWEKEFKPQKQKPTSKSAIITPKSIQANVDRMAFLFRHEFLVPDSDSEPHIDVLRRAVELAEDPEYKEARGALYDWQEKLVSMGGTGEGAIVDMKKLLAKYDVSMKRAKWKRLRHYTCFFAALAVPFAKEAALIPAATALAAEAGVKIIEFISGNNEPAIPQSLGPAVGLQ
jgi:hypothetical protein